MAPLDLEAGAGLTVACHEVAPSRTDRHNGGLVMRIAALYDIHGNLPALEAVLHEVRESAIDQIIVGGDVVPGPMVREALSCLLRIEIPIVWILGNSERGVAAQALMLEVLGCAELRHETAAPN